MEKTQGGPSPVSLPLFSAVCPRRGWRPAAVPFLSGGPPSRPAPDTRKSTKSRFSRARCFPPSRGPAGARGGGCRSGMRGAVTAPLRQRDAGGRRIDLSSYRPRPAARGKRPQLKSQAGGLRPRRTLARSLARSHITTVTGDTMAAAAAACHPVRKQRPGTRRR